MISNKVLEQLKKKHSISFEGCKPLTSTGTINDSYALGEKYVLRVPTSFGNPVAQARREAKAIPSARAAGVKTPCLIAFNEECDILTVPYLIVEKIGGTNFESLKRDPSEIPRVWLDLGRDLAKLHEGNVDLGPPDWVDRYNLGDPLPWIEASAREGRISSSEAQWFQEWLRRLESMVRRANFGRKRFAHADVQMSNVMTAESGDYSALIDWGCALMWEDVTVDFVSMPLSAATLLLQGHREIAKLDEDDTAEARIVWRRIWEKFIDPPTGKTLSWYWQPSGRGAELRTFFTNPPNERWRAIGPPWIPPA